MVVTADDIKTLVIEEVGDSDDQILNQLWNTIWDSYADMAQIWPRLQELYSKRRCINILLGRIRKDVDFTIAAALHGTTDIKVSQRFSNLLKLRDEVTAEISIEEGKARSYRPGFITQITRTEIEVSPDIEPFPAIPDANSPLYRGDAYLSPGLGTGTAGSI